MNKPSEQVYSIYETGYLRRKVDLLLSIKSGSG